MFWSSLYCRLLSYVIKPCSMEQAKEEEEEEEEEEEGRRKKMKKEKIPATKRSRWAIFYCAELTRGIGLRSKSGAFLLCYGYRISQPRNNSGVTGRAWLVLCCADISILATFVFLHFCDIKEKQISALWTTDWCAWGCFGRY